MLFSIDGPEAFSCAATGYDPAFEQPIDVEETGGGALFGGAWPAAGFAGEDGHPEHMLPEMDAQVAPGQQLVPSAGWPWSAIVKLTVSFPSGHDFTASGVMVGRNDVLTAAHVVYQPDEGGYPTSVVVTPASLRGDESPWGSYHAMVQIADVQFDPDGDGRIVPGNGGPGLVGSERDIALLALRTPLGDRTGWMPIDTDFKEGWAHLSGYPNAHGLHLTDGVAWAYDSSVDSYTDISNFEVHHGDSGGPVWHFDRFGRPAVVALVSTGNDFNDADPSNDRGVAAVDLAPYYATPGQMLRAWIPANDHLIA